MEFKSSWRCLAGKNLSVIVAALILVQLTNADVEKSHCSGSASCRDSVWFDGQSDSLQDSTMQLLQHKSSGRRVQATLKDGSTAEVNHTADLVSAHDFPPMRFWTNLMWSAPLENATSRLWILHVPKAAGTSLYNDLSIKYANVNNTISVISAETCLPTMMSQTHSEDLIAIMFREPIALTYSEYWQCRVGPTFRNELVGSPSGPFENLSTWLNHYASAPALASPKEADLDCFHPLNLQTRALTCTRETCHQYQETNLQEALDRLRKPNVVVGLTEYYQESRCLIEFRQGGKLPSYCNCEDRDAWSSFVATHETHFGVPSHNISELSKEQIEAIEKLTVLDRQLYPKAKKVFFSAIEEAEKQLSTKILCKDQSKSA
eukprot:TRINITY_DN13040_c0_g1_i1.p1 TRINITY_DN13040_c0_g1~~TRINITY_DN13040_c0_g1_i1.p1  ORF type:complete len:376 (+),score=47.61 TRINITY_DN13040_c0_g1_i1:149-1276(+)